VLECPYFSPIFSFSVLFVSHVYRSLLQIYAGLGMAVFEPSFPPSIPTPDRVFDESLATRCTTVLVVPTFVEVSIIFYPRRRVLTHQILNSDVVPEPRTSQDDEAIQFDHVRWRSFGAECG
jgi:hypothetical protein